MELKLQLRMNAAFSYDAQSRDILKNGFYGSGSSAVKLSDEELMYLIEVRSAECYREGKILHAEDVVKGMSAKKRLLTRYFAYKDWRDRGLVALNGTVKKPSRTKTMLKDYRSKKIDMKRYKASATFFREDLVSMIFDNESGKKLYDEQWFGQYGTYKAADHGQFNKLDIFEAMYLLENKSLRITNSGKREMLKLAIARRPDFKRLYEVYRDWRSHGYVVKTGFKFGTHFRIYMPGASPVRNDKWIHSKHVIQVFPRETRLLISEWARAIRVAHSVRKTFILAIPGKGTVSKIEPDFTLYHRSKGNTENPRNSSPRYAMLALNEDQYIGGKELAGAIKSSKKHGLELILGIVDRETSVTYYKVRNITLRGSTHEYYEIEWMQP